MKLIRLIKDNKTTFIMIFFFLLGLMILLYPSISSYTNTKIQSKAINNYEEIINDKRNNYESYFKEAEEYNKKLTEIVKPLYSYKKLGDVSKILQYKDTKMIGYLYIEKIRVDLPIYYGTKAEVLNTSAGLLEGSSFPIGGIGTHAVISAHRGLPSSLLFTNLDKLEKGDTFTVKVLDRTLTYEVDQILIAKPKDINALEISKDNDYITLMTCTPYGINTHRLLVRGHRIENLEVKQYVSPTAFKIDKLIVTPIACIPILFIWLISIAFKPIKDNSKIYEKYIYPNGKKVN